MQPGVYVTAPAAAGSGIPATGTPYTALQYDVNGDYQETTVFIDVGGLNVLDIRNRYLYDVSNIIAINFATRYLTAPITEDVLLNWNNSLGTFSMPNIPTFATNALALAGGLTAGMLYKTAAGVLLIVV